MHFLQNAGLLLVQLQPDQHQHNHVLHWQLSPNHAHLQWTKSANLTCETTSLEYQTVAVL